MTIIRNTYKILIRRPEGRGPLVKSRRTWEDVIKIDLKEALWESVDWIDLAKSRELWPEVVFKNHGSVRTNWRIIRI